MGCDRVCSGMLLCCWFWLRSALLRGIFMLTGGCCRSCVCAVCEGCCSWVRAVVLLGEAAAGCVWCCLGCCSWVRAVVLLGEAAAGCVWCCLGCSCE
ncbi:hypothetical protein ACOSQ4_031750 [Xanthoceras sorbifolium]